MDSKLVIFDLDGTILNTLDDLKESLNYVLLKNDFPSKTLGEVKQMIGDGIKMLIAKAIPGDSLDLLDNMFEEFKEYYYDHSNDYTKPFDNMKNVLRTIKENGYKISVVTNKDDKIAKKLCDFYFENEFDLVQGETEKFARKPSTEMIDYVLKTLDVKKDNVYLIGDTEIDYRTALNANIKFIGVSYGFRDINTFENLGVKNIAKTPLDILKYIK